MYAVSLAVRGEEASYEGQQSLVDPKQRNHVVKRTRSYYTQVDRLRTGRAEWRDRPYRRRHVLGVALPSPRPIQQILPIGVGVGGVDIEIGISVGNGIGIGIGIDIGSGIGEGPGFVGENRWLEPGEEFKQI
jgi:hypothetical protein